MILLAAVLVGNYPAIFLAVAFCGYTFSGLLGEARLRLRRPEELQQRRELVRTATEETRRKDNEKAATAKPKEAV